ncbi:MAG: nucleoside phosphorylase [Verrucomicrobiales bacterium]|nr:nucleoside phosphorylase [Verrucomicrobiales bacterium]
MPDSGTEVLITGMGSENARAAISKYFESKRPARVITAGFAGGLDPTLELGAIVFNSQDASLAKALQNQGARGCNFLFTESVAVTADQKKQLRLKSGADAVEMESHAIAEVCREAHIHCSIVRVISDTSMEDLPLDFNRIMTSNKRISIIKLALQIIRSPAKIPKLIQFRKKTIFAAKQLGAALDAATAMAR